MTSIMTLPHDYEEKIGKPQVLSRVITMDGIQLLVRLQKPFEEAPYEEQESSKAVQVKIVNGKPVQVKPKEEYVPEFGTCLVVETWCDATKSVITTGIPKPPDKTPEQFSFGVRYMLNNSTDEEIIEVLKIKRLHLQLKYQTASKDDIKVDLPKPPKTKKKS